MTLTRAAAIFIIAAAVLAVGYVERGVVEDMGAKEAAGLEKVNAAQSSEPGAVPVSAAPSASPRLAEVSPPEPLCTATRYGGWPDRTLWRRYMIAQQADGGKWTHDCAYNLGTQL